MQRYNETADPSNDQRGGNPPEQRKETAMEAGCTQRARTPLQNKADDTTPRDQPTQPH